nr:unnamed protein product [Digitaria exilis]
MSSRGGGARWYLYVQRRTHMWVGIDPTGGGGSADLGRGGGRSIQRIKKSCRQCVGCPGDLAAGALSGCRRAPGQRPLGAPPGSARHGIGMVGARLAGDVPPRRRVVGTPAHRGLVALPS